MLTLKHLTAFYIRQSRNVANFLLLQKRGSYQKPTLAKEVDKLPYIVYKPYINFRHKYFLYDYVTKIFNDTYQAIKIYLAQSLFRISVIKADILFMFVLELRNLAGFYFKIK
jgi:hypothetical protein